MGQVIAGRFELLEHIASGATGSTWLALDRRRGRECAAKVLRQKDSGALLRFVREQGVRLDHPHLTTPYGWAAEDQDVAIAMPLVRGGTLESALADHGVFSPELVGVLLLQLLDGLRHMHDAGWLHRDVKPANILLEPTGTGRPHLRLGDFGTALRRDDPRLTEIGFVHGTPGYLAPEALLGAAPSPADDLYAAGIVALRMLHPTATSVESLAAVRAGLASAPRSDELTDVILGLTSDSPAHRCLVAAQAPARLGPLGSHETYLVSSGEPFEVFDQFERRPEPPPHPEPATMEPAAPPARTAARGPALMVAAGLLLIVVAIVLAMTL